MTKKTVTFSDGWRVSEDLLDTPVKPTGNFVTTEFVNRVSPQFTTTREFTINAHNPFHRVRVWIRSLGKNYLLLEEEFPDGTVEFKLEFGGLFSTFNTLSRIEIVLFNKWDERVRAVLCYHDLHFCIVPFRGTKRRAFMCTSPRCNYFKMLSRQIISVDGSLLEVEPDYTD